MNKNPLISVIMNGYNCERHLREAIESVLNQTYSNWEIIFWDNQSTDNTAKIVKSYHDKRIKYFYASSHEFLGKARNLALEKTGGTWIAFLDTDDIWFLNKLEKQLDAIEHIPQIVLCYTGAIFINENGKYLKSVIPVTDNIDVFRTQLIRYEVNMQSVILRKSAFSGFDNSKEFAPDFDLFMKIISKNYSYAIKEPLVKYRLHTSSLTNKKIHRWWIETQETLDDIFGNNENLKIKYPKEYKLAYAKVAYYKARYLMSISRYTLARKELSKNNFLNPIYFFIFILSFFPKFIWDFVHKIKANV